MEKKVESIYECKAYACYVNDKEELLKSTSGGVFFVLARKIIQEGGVVFGAAFKDNSNWDVRHTEAHTLEELDVLRESKYVQSCIGNSYIKAKKYLLSGRKVLFSGTPCQIAGLKGYLGCEYENLLTMEVICHGVPSARLLKEHLSNQEKVCGKEITGIKFRDKINGWKNVSVTYQFKDSSKTMRAREDDYYYCFNMCYSLRPSCYHCRFVDMNSGADIMMGDYWGIDIEHPEFGCDKGASAVVLLTSKGERTFDECKNQFCVLPTSVQKIAKYNIAVADTKGEKKGRKIFFDEYVQGQTHLSQIRTSINDYFSIIRVGLIGSYSLRKVMHALVDYNPGISEVYQITGSALCSMFGMKEERLIDKVKQIEMANAYRLSMLRNDMLKSAEYIISENKCDYIMIDFLEERYSLLKTRKSYYTKSEAFEDVKDACFCEEFVQEINMEEISFDLWKQYCDKLITILKKQYNSNQIILNRLYLTENMGGYKPDIKFSDIEKIRNVNQRLSQYYDYFEEKVKCYSVCVNNESTDYCPEVFDYGCKPEYYCEKRYREFRNRIIKEVEDL